MNFLIKLNGLQIRCNTLRIGLGQSVPAMLVRFTRLHHAPDGLPCDVGFSPAIKSSGKHSNIPYSLGLLDTWDFNAKDTVIFIIDSSYPIAVLIRGRRLL